MFGMDQVQQLGETAVAVFGMPERGAGGLGALTCFGPFSFWCSGEAREGTCMAFLISF